VTPHDQVPASNENGSLAMSRRKLAQNLLSWILVGAVPGLSAEHPICRHLLAHAGAERSGKVLSADESNRRFLSPTQFEALAKIAEAIVPGSGEAQSATFIDLLLGVDSTATQHSFAEALAAFESAARRNFQHNLAALNRSQLDELLQAASEARSNDHQHFENLKGWAVGAYYSSEVGMRELGWKQDRIFSSYPACDQAQGHS
jgi:hypothetical protein